VPNRPAAIAGTGASCLPELVRSARALHRAGADFIVIPCVTVHHFHAALQKRSPLPILHIVEETVKHVRREYPRARRVGLLARGAAIGSGLFQRAFEGSGVELLVSDDRRQQAIETAVELIKVEGATARPRRLIAGVAGKLVDRGAQLIIAGCTEIPLVLKNGDLKVPVIDVITVLAEAAIARAGGKRRR
jgi:aspartate racemase